MISNRDPLALSSQSNTESMSTCEYAGLCVQQVNTEGMRFIDESAWGHISSASQIVFQRELSFKTPSDQDFRNAIELASVIPAFSHMDKTYRNYCERCL